MMTSAVRTKNRLAWRAGEQRGMTLLETILAMVIVLVVIGVGLAYQFTSNDKELLRKASIRIEAMSSRGHAMSVLHQKPFWIRIEHDKVVLAGADVRRQGGRESTPSGSIVAGKFTVRFPLIRCRALFS